MLGMVCLGVVATLGTWGWRAWCRPHPVAIPEVKLSAEADPQLVEALAAATEAVRREPDSAARWGRLGMLLLANGFADESAPCLAQAERLEPDEPRWPYLQAIPLLIRDRDAALSHLRRAVELCDQKDPDNTTPRLMLAEVFLEKDEFDEVEALCRHVLEKQPDNPRAHFNFGMAALARNDLQSGIDHLTHSAASPFARQRSYAQLAAAYLRLGDKEASAKFSREARQAPPDLLWSDPYILDYQQLAPGRQNRLLSAEALEKQGQLREATKILMEVAEQFPDDRSYVALGVALAKLGNDAAAERLLRESLRQAPDKVNAHYALSVVLFRQGEQRRKSDATAAAEKYRAAAASARRAVELKPDHALAYLYLGQALNALGQKKDALDAFRMAVRCRPELAEGHLQLGEALAAEGHKDEALVHLQYAVELAHRDDKRPQEALARVRDNGKP